VSVVTSGVLHDAVETGVFQVQRRAVGEKDQPSGPWQLEARCATREAALAHIRSQPVDWTVARVFCDPREVEFALLAAGVVPSPSSSSPPLRPEGITSGAGLIMLMHANGEIDDTERERLMREHFEDFATSMSAREGR